MNFDPMRPIWLQVAVLLKQQVATGQLAPGEKLPGGRDLAMKYGINPNTAARIYQELEREGVCVTRRGLGTFITEDRAVAEKIRADMARLAVNRFLEELAGLGIDRREAAQLILEEDDNHADK